MLTRDGDPATGDGVADDDTAAAAAAAAADDGPGAAPVSVVIPAHNEQAVIDRCLRALRTGAPAGALDIVVVCNGCTDRTAELARAAGARVVETPRPGKAGALNLGDAAVTSFPRFYVDADVVVRGDVLLKTADLLRTDAAMAAAPRLAVDLTGVSWPVRSFYRLWMRQPFVGDGHVGSGVVGLNEAGRGRFEHFPEIIADDLFLYTLFSADERRAARPGVEFTIFPARTVRAHLHRLVRVYAGNLQLGQTEAKPDTSANGRSGWARVVREDPRRAVDIPCYVGMVVLAQLLAHRKLRRGDVKTWERDNTSRTTSAGAA
ncbi:MULTISPECIES: glycosyltransferase family 2 protein [unclassified Frankia]|uniref:glycosyltransferase family 2 protein n=1 Tax=unclassified Frankia TaxID=2632575 RepID=UPI002AD4B58F|nr:MULTISPECIES: glycosyltransferase family 2 protein [unclassified Frankia]